MSNTPIISRHQYMSILARLALALLCTPMFILAFADTVTAQTGLSVASADKEILLQNELDSVNQEIAGLNNTIGGLKSVGTSLTGDIKLLKANTDRLNVLIKRQSALVAQLGVGIVEKSRTVKNLGLRIDREKQSLAQLVRKTNEIDQTSLPEMLLSGDDLSDFFLDLDSFDAIRAGLKDSTDTLRGAKEENQAAQDALETKQQQEMDAKAGLERSKSIVQSNEAEKNRLLKITKNKEAGYAKVLADRKKRAAEIRAALFALRDSGEISFGKAYDYAVVVSGQTGIRPAFLLAIFMQESSFGKNQGSCVLKNKATGAGISVTTGNTKQKVMNPTRDVPPFLSITAQLGRDPYNTRVSCPQEVGWGGAMGAAQFIPSTWVMFEKRITKALGTDAADPWNARDAFMAAGMYLSDLGAKSGSYTAERNAACRYFSGSKCAASSWAATYGSQVMTKAESIQTSMIDPLNS
ncbi:MAG: hypothetical protein A2845_03700 [Candidatus Lloydbacteria bacterium RIFCSPHIGHO2_01_FULL_49_22]|uniref:Transglycosylase SLT domain-containing protein n=1 Tax=Candidatus Lloydbacteria bacterium RIFCSPHIGHO2_01_FULL_49_22 TaxID=1798658 RepID=A0A1G2CZ12_9BACT|nr:MAG: hypothetical protein A2845_03700 [Candidatus Lloydbacteria bacterium RIFCSPHIGHO2_01_FULL_49_22]OGZ09034.1 MAG: hypothetical protein A3C14_03535 [Candidatus Lloydbacteria bacterium RIFCSPHIGHO2_02_FULL_50_18]